MRVRLIIGGAAVLAATTACGATKAAAPPATAAAGTSTSTSVTVTATAAAPTVTKTVANPTAAVAGGRCHTSQLTVSARGAPGGASHAGIAIVLTNTGSVTCTLYGYPGVGLLTSTKQLSPTVVPRGQSYLFRDPGPHTVTLAPGAAASAGFSFLDGEGYGPTVSCSPVAYLRITPPDETAALLLPFQPGDTDGELCGVEGVTALTAGTDVGQEG